MAADVQLIGTRAEGVRTTWSLLDDLRADDATGVAFANAYWDARSLERTIDAARAVGGVARVLLWTAGSTHAGWIAARELSRAPELDVRFVDSPEERGIFHVKLAGSCDDSGRWLCAALGSANLTDAALRSNVELGVVIRGDDDVLDELRRWFDDQFAHATRADELEWDAAIEIAPEKSEAAERRRLFAQAALATPARASAPAPTFDVS
jgi:phosphatidylserine/phosphatidylglycerophosphate/cardiolipin synthase-like enzyme